MARWASLTILAIGLAITSNFVLLCFGDNSQETRKDETDYSDNIKNPDHLWVEDESFDENPIITPIINNKLVVNKTEKR